MSRYTNIIHCMRVHLILNFVHFILTFPYFFRINFERCGSQKLYINFSNA